MGWSIGYDTKWERDIGYGVPAYCDHPGCMAEIDRGLAYVCIDAQVRGGRRGCGRYYCGEHRGTHKCKHKGDHVSPEHPDWVAWKLTDESWQEWRDKHPEKVAALTEQTP